MNTTREDLEKLDRDDPLKEFGEEFNIPEGILYFDGNSLGALPKATLDRVNEVVSEEWGKNLITSWNIAGWHSLSEKIGNKIATLIGADDGEVVCVDGTGLNIYKLHAVALRMRSDRKVILMEGSNFPTDAYITQGLIRHLGQNHEIRFVEKDGILDSITEDVALVSLTQVHYKMGHLLDMKAITQKAHDVGALVVWDLCHSAGALPVKLNLCNVDFAVGCTYKFLNGGPGAPAFLFVAKRHQGKETQPLTGWWGHDKQRRMLMESEFRQLRGAEGWQLSGPPIFSLAPLEASLAIFDQARLSRLRQKSEMLTAYLQYLLENKLAAHIKILTPNRKAERGCQLSVKLKVSSKKATEIGQNLRHAGVVADWRQTDILRLAPSPLYNRFHEVFQTVRALERVLHSK